MTDLSFFRAAGIPADMFTRALVCIKLMKSVKFVSGHVLYALL